MSSVYDFDAQLNRETNAYLRELDQREVDYEYIAAKVINKMDCYDATAIELYEMNEITIDQYNIYLAHESV